jgi:lipoprotein-releasing system permease protein
VNWLEILQLARRYTFAFGRGYLSTFLSSLSMLGLVLAITLLITVMSVMNGFDKEMRERILALVPHITVYSHLPVEDWRAAAAAISVHPEVAAVAPFAQFDALFMRGSAIETTRGIGLDVALEQTNGHIFSALGAPEIERFRTEPDGLILGSGIAAKLGARPGDRITLIVPAPGKDTVESSPRFDSVILSAVLETGTELDQSAALVHLALASQLAGLDGAVTGLRVATRDIFQVSRIGWELMNALPSGYFVTNWMMTHGNLYSAIQLSRDLIAILLFSIIAVAAFNVVSSLVLVVFDKRGDIAILRTLGASPANIAWIFVFQGAMIGLVGVSLGLSFGALSSLLVPDLVAWLEHLLGIRFLNTDVYPVSFLPVDVQASDLLLVGGVAFAMCVLAAVYPAFRAARLAPAAILQQD